MHRPNDTIAAIATPPGRGGVGIVRVSGPEAPSIAAAILGRVPPPRHADYRVFRDSDGSTIDHGLALYFPAPHSYTGEDVLELHGHGGTMVLDLVTLRVYAESAIDFPEEEIDFLGDGHLAAALASLISDIEDLLATSEQGRLLRDGLREHIHLDGLPLHVIDTAGLRDSADPVETQGIARAWAEIAEADRILLVIDDRPGLTSEALAIVQRLPAASPLTVIHNKIDLSGRAPDAWQDALGIHLALSAKQGEGIDLLQRHLTEHMGYHGGEGAFMARRRHLDALRRALAQIERGRDALRERRAGELLAEDLRLAQHHLNEITGAFGADDLLGRIFAEFCIGK